MPAGRPAILSCAGKSWALFPARCSLAMIHPQVTEEALLFRKPSCAWLLTKVLLLDTNLWSIDRAEVNVTWCTGVGLHYTVGNAAAAMGAPR